ncbi:hypothetical protein B0H67DRAFT_573451 [Lasiosphaeris hirsuta]|uniref:F-box domain-containing protein n=1 Tax=Lasiosphaeris hirsuta TaxID=260670 RepID=A0AA40APG4_9PEZI|nr:hypothetical protein B0H67DRAFT_573451 [Lasiosphaeris hirsuta]
MSGNTLLGWLGSAKGKQCSESANADSSIVPPTTPPKHSQGEDNDEDEDGVWKAEMESGLKSGQAHMASLDYAKALSSIMKAIAVCPCSPTTHGKDKSCNILQCTVAVRNPDPGALLEVANNPCTCGKRWPSCARSLHTQAADTLVECLEKAKRHVAAFSTALGLIRLNPASPMGYCRIAKIIRFLLKNSQSDADAARSLAVLVRDTKLGSAEKLRALINDFVRSGLNNARKDRQGLDDIYHTVLRKMAHSLQMPESRIDPVKKLPREVLGIIFAYLETPALCRSLRVDKQWNQLLLSDKMLWTHLRIKTPGNPGRTFDDFVKKHPEIRSFVLDEIYGFSMTVKKGRKLLGMPNLQRLHLGTTKRLPIAPYPIVPSQEPRLKNLTHLSLYGVTCTPATENLVTMASKCLEVLDLVLFPALGHPERIGSSILDLPMPKLKKLRLIFKKERGSVNMKYLAEYAPKLKHIYLDGLVVDGRGDSGQGTMYPFTVDEPRRWPDLKSLVIGKETTAPVLPWAVAPERCVPLMPNVETIELLTQDPSLVHSILFSVNAAAGKFHPYLFDGEFPSEYLESLKLPRLKHFRCDYPVAGDLLRMALGTACESGTLEVLKLSAESTGGPSPRHRDIRHPYQASTPIPTLDWAFLRSDNLRTLGLSHFNWASDDSYYSAFNGQPFLDWLACFPKVDTVHVYPGDNANIAPFMMKLVCHPQIKTVYQDHLTGVDWDEARALASTRGVDLRHTKNGPVPPSWSGVDDW